VRRDLNVVTVRFVKLRAVTIRSLYDPLLTLRDPFLTEVSQRGRGREFRRFPPFGQLIGLPVWAARPPHIEMDRAETGPRGELRPAAPDAIPGMDAVIPPVIA
jgi:hypothetical protein